MLETDDAAANSIHSFVAPSMPMTIAPPPKSISANKRQPLTAKEQWQLTNLVQCGKIPLDKVKEKATWDPLESKI